MLVTQPSLDLQLDEFAQLANAEPNLPLIVCHSEDQLKLAHDYLSSKGFATTNNFDDLLDSLSKAGSYITILSSPHKSLYDAITQYPMGQLQLTKPANLGPILITPNYDSSRVLIITNHHLDAWAEQGYDLLRSCGITLRLDNTEATK